MPNTIKADFHCHSKEDPKDSSFISYSAEDAARTAAKKGLRVFCLSHHLEVYWPESFPRLCQDLGLLSVPSCELNIQKKDVLVNNITPESARKIKTFADLLAFKRNEGTQSLIIAPHPLHIFGASIGRKLLEENIECFDAIELSHFHLKWWSPTAAAALLARELGLPTVATSDAHHLQALGANYTELEYDPKDWAEVKTMILRNRTRAVCPKLDTWRFSKKASSTGIALVKRKLKETITGK